MDSENSESHSYLVHEVWPWRLQPPRRPNDENDEENGAETDRTMREDVQVVDDPENLY